MASTISKEDLIGRFADTMGVEKAQDLIDETLAVLEFAEKDFFAKKRALEICEAVKEKGGMIGITAGFIKAEIQLMNE